MLKRKVTFSGKIFIAVETREDYTDKTQKITINYHEPDPSNPDLPGNKVGHEIIDKGVLTEDTFMAGNFKK